MLRDELHLHLYGCLTADDIWELGRDRWQAQADRITWFGLEYRKQYGRVPDVAAYWRDSDGRELLADDFLFTEPGPFAQFQARFNLLIALFPISPDDTTVLRRVLARHLAAGRRYVEYRSFIPPLFDADQIARLYISYATAALAVEAESGGQFMPRLAFSVSRVNNTALKQYKVLREVLAARPDLVPALAGLDFCGVEEGFRPADKRSLFELILKDNAKNPDRALAILYHVGESFTDKTVVSAARWVHEAHSIGAHRLGHAIALGVSPERYGPIGGQARVIEESAGERRDHLAWLFANQFWLADRGYRFDHQKARAEMERVTVAPVAAACRYVYDEAALADTRSLQDALIADLAAKGAVIESCPTSNRLIGEIHDFAHHPLPRFVQGGLAVTLGSDDPGIFDCDLADEERLCRQVFGFGDEVIAQFGATAAAARSELLAGRTQ